MSDYDSESNYESRRTISGTERSPISASRWSDESDEKSDHIADNIVYVYSSDDHHYASSDVESKESQDLEIHVREQIALVG